MQVRSTGKFVKVDLINIDHDSSFAGDVKLGSNMQSTKLVFDTGSEYLAVTSNLCDDDSSEGFDFKKYSPDTNTLLDRKNTKGRCHTKAYDTRKSDTSKVMQQQATKITYGTAEV